MQTLEQINDQLKQPLDVKRVKKRAGGGGNQLSYIETHDAIATLNRVFGFDGWQFELLQFEQFATTKGAVYRQTARLTVWIGDRKICREDVGIGIGALSKDGKGVSSDQIEKGMKEAASDCLKRCARTLGEQFGNSLYEKDAPEHKGQQRARIATQEQLTECETLRGQAVKLGLLAKSGNPPLIAQDGAEERIVLAKTKAYRDYIQEHGDKGQSETVANELPDVAASLAARFERMEGDNKAEIGKAFLDACDGAKLPYSTPADVEAFVAEFNRLWPSEKPATLSELGAEDFAVVTETIEAGGMRWGA